MWYGNGAKVQINENGQKTNHFLWPYPWGFISAEDGVQIIKLDCVTSGPKTVKKTNQYYRYYDAVMMLTGC